MSKRSGWDDAILGVEDAGALNGELLLSLGLDQLLPAELARWRPLVLEGMAFFLERLPASRLMEIMAEQMSMPADAPSADRVVALLARCPTLHKLGQVLARHHQLPPELRRHLQTLESMPPSLPMAELSALIYAELPADAPIVLADEALAEGSVAVVVPFTYRVAPEDDTAFFTPREGQENPGRPFVFVREQGRIGHGVFKVLKPGIEARLSEELAILAEVAAFLEERSRALGLPPIDYRDTLNGVGRLLANEVRLDGEQANLRAAARFYADEPRLLVPRLLPWCSPRLTAMERVFGCKVEAASLPEASRRGMAALMISALLAKPFWTRSGEAIFHGDLHGGNLLVAEDGRLAVIDWSLTARLGKTQREALVAMALGGFCLDAATIRRAVAMLGAVARDDTVLADVIEASLDRLVCRGGLPGFDWLLALLDDLATRGAAGFHEDFALFRKTWFSLAGVIRDLAGSLSPDLPLLEAGLKRFATEFPARLVAWPNSHSFATHVSNSDILNILASSWLTSVRYWNRVHQLACWPGDRPQPQAI